MVLQQFVKLKNTISKYFPQSYHLECSALKKLLKYNHMLHPYQAQKYIELTYSKLMLYQKSKPFQEHK